MSIILLFGNSVTLNWRIEVMFLNYDLRHIQHVQASMEKLLAISVAFFADYKYNICWMWSKYLKTK